MPLPLISPNLNLGRGISQTRQQLFDLQRQLATGKRVETYGALGSERTLVLSLRGELSQIEGYRQTISQVQIRLNVTQISLDRIRDLASDARTDTIGAGFDLRGDGQTDNQTIARARLEELTSLLNTDVAGRFVFAGKQTDKSPVLAARDFLDGAGGRAGYRQIAAERRLADLGADGRGRLVIPAASSGLVSLSEDSAGSPFGFKIAAVNSQLGGTSVTGPAGAPASLKVDFSAILPADREIIAITLDLPDGTQTDLVLTARAGAPEKAGEFQIGADAASTAANFQAALAEAVENNAQTTLSAASLLAAAGDFFDFDAGTPPQRVDGPPFETATALSDATAADTVFWYEGDLSATPARQSALTKADDAIVVAYGARADEAAFRTAIKQLAALSVEIFSPADDNARNRFDQINQRVGQNLRFASNEQSIDDIVAELTVAQYTLGAAEDRHTSSENLILNSISNIEEADVYEVSSQLLQLQVRLEASYQTTSILSRISLVNFL